MPDVGRSSEGGRIGIDSPMGMLPAGGDPEGLAVEVPEDDQWPVDLIVHIAPGLADQLRQAVMDVTCGPGAAAEGRPAREARRGRWKGTVAVGVDGIVLLGERRAGGRCKRIHVSLRTAAAPISAGPVLQELARSLGRPNPAAAAAYERATVRRRMIAAGAIHERHDGDWSRATIRLGTSTSPPMITIVMKDGCRLLIGQGPPEDVPAIMSPGLAAGLTDDDDAPAHVTGYENGNDIVVIIGPAPDVEVVPGSAVDRLHAAAATEALRSRKE